MSKLAKGLLTLLIGRERFSVKEWKRSQHSSNQMRRNVAQLARSKTKAVKSDIVVVAACVASYC